MRVLVPCFTGRRTLFDKGQDGSRQVHFSGAPVVWLSTNEGVLDLGVLADGVDCFLVHGPFAPSDAGAGLVVVLRLWLTIAVRWRPPLDFIFPLLVGLLLLTEQPCAA